MSMSFWHLQLHFVDSNKQKKIILATYAWKFGIDVKKELSFLKEQLLTTYLSGHGTFKLNLRIMEIAARITKIFCDCDSQYANRVFFSYHSSWFRQLLIQFSINIISMPSLKNFTFPLKHPEEKDFFQFFTTSSSSNTLNIIRFYIH